MRSPVALESAVISHGLPFPENVNTALRLEGIILEESADPITIAILKGRYIVGLSKAQIRHLASTEDIRKVSLRDIPVARMRALDGATTVASTMWIAHQNNIFVIATGGIGGVHRKLSGPGTGSFDISNDLEVLARLPMTVVCAGPKGILDHQATREILETRGITVVGYGTDTMPAFYSRSSGLPVDVRCDTPAEVAEIVSARETLAIPGSTLVTVPIPEEAAIPREVIEPAIERVHQEAHSRGLASSELTPFILNRIGEITGRRALWANIALLENNARIAARIARAISELKIYDQRER